MISPVANHSPSRRVAVLFAVIVVAWLAVASSNLYFFGYASMDSWCYAAPAAMARAPLALTTPFLGAFERSNEGWGIHWPGGPLLTSMVTPFLPRNPATLVSIYVGYWLLLCLAAAALVRRLSFSPWLAIGAFLLVAGDRSCFGVTWLERYELLDGAIAIAAILALCGPWEFHPLARSVTVGLAFFLLPLLHPVFSGLAMAWLAFLGFGSLVLRRPWKRFVIAVIAYALGWAGFVAYYRSRPWLYAQFLNHARINVELTRSGAPPGIHTFLAHLSVFNTPTRGAALVIVIALAWALYFPYAAWKSGRGWKEFLVREELAIFAAIGVVCTLFLAQFSYNIVYWSTAWPFAVVVACDATHHLLQRFPHRRGLMAGGFAFLLLLNSPFLPARTWLWYRNGFLNLRAQASQFASTLPRQGRLFIPEALWDSFAESSHNIYLNTLPYSAGDPSEKDYAAYIGPMIRSGDVLVTDRLQSHGCLIDPHPPGWKEIEHRRVIFIGEGGPHGFDLAAWQKQ